MDPGRGGCDRGEIVRVDDAEVRSTFVGGMLDGLPAITRHGYGDGVGWYVATAPDDLASVVDAVLNAALPELPVAPPEHVEILERGGVRFVLNHSAEPVTVDGIELGPHGSSVTAV